MSPYGSEVPVPLELEQVEQRGRIAESEEGWSGGGGGSSTPEPTINDPKHCIDWDKFDPEIGLGGEGESIACICQNDDIATLPGQGVDASGGLIELLAKIWRNEKSRNKLCRLTEGDAQTMVDYLYSVLMMAKLPEYWHRRHFIIALYKLSRRSQRYPHCYGTLKESIELDAKPQSSNGMYSDILKGPFGGQELCLKRIRISEKRDLEAMLKIYAKEAILWGQLKHPNIVMFYGIFCLKNDAVEKICLVSPWMENGTLCKYLEENKSAPRVLFAYDVVNGMSYLHELGLIHSDLKGTNILVNDLKQACITDFGVSFIWTDNTLAQTIGTSTHHGRDLRWAAPELQEEGKCATMASDMWALGCVCSEILTGKKPYNELGNARDIMKKMDEGIPPAQRTPETSSGPAKKAIWKEAERCWEKVPIMRPKCGEVLKRLRLAGLSRKTNYTAQRDAEKKKQEFRDEMGIDPDKSPDLEQVRRILDDLDKDLSNEVYTVGSPIPPTSDPSTRARLAPELVIHQQGESPLAPGNSPLVAPQSPQLLMPSVTQPQPQPSNDGTGVELPSTGSVKKKGHRKRKATDPPADFAPPAPKQRTIWRK